MTMGGASTDTEVLSVLFNAVNESVDVLVAAELGAEEAPALAPTSVQGAAMGSSVRRIDVSDELSDGVTWRCESKVDGAVRGVQCPLEELFWLECSG